MYVHHRYTKISLAFTHWVNLGSGRNRLTAATKGPMGQWPTIWGEWCQMAIDSEKEELSWKVAGSNPKDGNYLESTDT